MIHPDDWYFVLQMQYTPVGFILVIDVRINDPGTAWSDKM